MPTLTLQNNTPFSKLFHKPPSYTTLKVFGCLCYPWLPPYSKHKLDHRSTPCIFLGYYPQLHAYKCFDQVNNKIYISKHVVFFETEFPFSLHSRTTSLRSSLSHWPTTHFTPPISPSPMTNNIQIPFKLLNSIF